MANTHRVPVLILAAVAATFLGCGTGSDTMPRRELALLQHVSSTGDDSSVTATWPSATDRGNLLVMAVHVDWTSGIGKIEVPAGWQLIERADHAGFRNLTAALYVQEGAPQQASDVTVSVASAVPSIKISLAEYSGVRTSDSLDRHARATGESTRATSGATSPTTQDNELWIAVIANAAGFAQCDPTNAFERVEMPIDGASALGLYDRVAAASGPAEVAVTFRGLDCTGTDDAFATEWAGVVATFRH